MKGRPNQSLEGPYGHVMAKHDHEHIVRFSYHIHEVVYYLQVDWYKLKVYGRNAK